MNDVAALEEKLRLPPIWPLQPIGESYNVYGIAEIARDYIGMPYVPRLIPGFWIHGWQGDWYHLHPEVICPHRPSEKELLKWTPRESQAAYLRSQGYVNAKAIGHPITYLPEPRTTRRPGSLLVMPCRSWPGFKRDTDGQYAAAIHELSGQFSEVVICISAQSYDAGDWVDSFQKYGFRMVRGASVRDRNGFHRMAQLLSQFEYVTTNGTGSQAAYAAYFGAKTSVWGPEPAVPPPDKPRRLFLALPHLREEIHKANSVEELLRHEPWLGVHPLEARANVEWARQALGAENRLPPAELQREFQWLPEQLREVNLEIEALHTNAHAAQKELISKLKTATQEAEARNAELEKLKSKLAKLEKAQAKAEKELEKLRPIANSRTWKLAKPLYKLERRGK
jgi:hypothetical protein